MNQENERLVSVLFADVAGSVRLHERLGGDEAQWAIERCLKRAARCIEAFGGSIASTVGHELMGIFDSAPSAFQAAIEMQQKVADLPPVSGLKLEIRVGFAYGPAQLSANGIAGEASNIAAWLAGTAKPGQILTNAPTLHALPPPLQQSLIDLGPATSGGKMSGVHIYSHSTEAQDPRPLDQTTPKAASLFKLRLTHAGADLTLDGHPASFSLGRDETCNLIIKGHKVSRLHATIEFYENRFTLVDRSTNGTFVKVGKEPEIRLHRKEFPLRGKGIIGLATSTHSADTDSVVFALSDVE